MSKKNRKKNIAKTNPVPTNEGASEEPIYEPYLENNKAQKKVKQKIEQLTAKKEELQTKITNLSLILLGDENPENAKKIGELEAEKAILTKQLEELNSEVKSLNSKINNIQTEISNIGDDEQIEELFSYFKGKRWFFFENRKMFLFDKQYGMLWANLNNYTSPNHFEYVSAHFIICEEINWHNLANWRLPDKYEFWNMIEDKSFPFQSGSNWRINNNGYWLTSEGRIYTEACGPNWSTERDPAPFIPCNSTYATDKFKPATISEFIDDEIERKKVEDLIAFFVEQDWIPTFDDEELAEIYEIYDDEEIAEIYETYAEKVKLLKELEPINKQLTELTKETKRKIITADFDFQLPLMNYKLDEINNSAIKYYRNSVKWINDLIIGLDDFGNENSEFMSGIKKIQMEMSKEYKYISDFTEAENSFFRKYYHKFQNIFDFDFDIIKQKLFGFREEAETQLDVLNSIGSAKDKIVSLAKIEKQERPDFHFFAEYTGEMVQEKLQKFVWYQEENQNINSILLQIKEWFDDFLVFTDKTKNDFFKKCENESIEKDVYTIWVEDWRKERYLIISKVFTLISESFNPKKLDEKTVLEILKTAENYREQLDEFYSEERLNIHQKFAFQAGGELQEKFEKEMELAKITTAFTNNLQKIMFAGSSANKIFILRWANAWFDSQIEQIVLFAEKSKLTNITPIFTEMISKMQALQKQNMEVFLNDLQTFSQMVKKRNDEYNSLMFKMRKELRKGK